MYCAGPMPDEYPVLPGVEWEPQDLSRHRWDSDDAGYSWQPVDGEPDLHEQIDPDILSSDTETGAAYCPVCGGVLAISAFP